MKKMITRLMATAINFVYEGLRSLVRRPIMGMVALANIALQIALAIRFPFSRALMLYGGVGVLGFLAIFSLTRLREGNIDTDSLHESGFLTKKDRLVQQFDQGYSKPNETIVLLSGQMKAAIAILSAIVTIAIFSLGEYDAILRYFTNYHANRGMVYAEYLAGQDALQWTVLSWVALMLNSIVLCDVAEVALLSMECCFAKVKILRSASSLLDATLDFDSLEEIPEVPATGSYREIKEIFPVHEPMSERERRVRTVMKNRIDAGKYVPESTIRDLCLVGYAREARECREAAERRADIKRTAV